MSDGMTNTYGDDIHLVPVDAASIYNDLITSLERETGEPLYPGDERRIYGEALAAVFVALYSTMDDAARQTMLRYARGEVLDAIGERLDVHRLTGDRASTVMRFSAGAPPTMNIIIPEGTRVTPDGNIYFATDQAAVLQAGDTSVDVPVTADSQGTQYNGFAPGAIATLVDMLPYIERVINVTETAGGSDGEPYTKAGDDRLRERIRLAPAKLSNAGPEQAYIYWAMTADSSIADVKAVSEVETITRTLPVYAGHAFLGGDTLLPNTLTVCASGEQGDEVGAYTADYDDGLLTITLSGTLAEATQVSITIRRTMEGRVKIVPLLQGGELPDEAMLEKVLDKIKNANVCPLTDHVSAVAPDVVPYDIEITYYTTPETEAEVIANVEGPGGALDRFNAWQTASLGRDVNPDQLRRLILAPTWGDHLTGAIRLDVVKPEHAVVEDTEVAAFSGNLVVNHKSVLGVI